MQQHREGDIYRCSKALLIENCLTVTNSNYEDLVRVLTGKKRVKTYDCESKSLIKFILFQSSSLLLSVMVVSLVCTVSLGLLGHQVVMAAMAVKEPKVIRAARGRLDPRDLQELLVSMERMASKENLESRALPAEKGSGERAELVEFLGLLV